MGEVTKSKLCGHEYTTHYVGAGSYGQKFTGSSSFGIKSLNVLGKIVLLRALVRWAHIFYDLFWNMLDSAISENSRSNALVALAAFLSCHTCVLHLVLVNLWVYHSAKVLDCMCLLSCERAYEPRRVPEPAPWISVVGLSKHEQSRIKSILILARQEPLLLLGDTSTDRKEKREQTPHLLLLLSSLLSHSFAPSSYSTSFSSFHSVSFSSLIPLLHCLMLPSLTSPTQH